MAAMLQGSPESCQGMVAGAAAYEEQLTQMPAAQSGGSPA